MANVTGLITVNEKDILEVDADPSAGGGTPAPRGSLAMFDSGSVGQLYIKTGTADTAWSLVDSDTADWSLNGNTLTGGSPTTPNEFFGSNNDYDVIFKRNAIELMRMVGSTAALQGLLIGLNSSLGGRLQLQPTNLGDDILKEISASANSIINVTRMFRVTTVGAATSTFDIAIPNDYVCLLETRAAVRQTGGSGGSVGDGASYVRTVHAKNIGGTVTILKTQTDFTYEITNGINFTSAASGANVEYSAIGVVNRNFTWGVHTTLLLTNT